MDKNTRLIQNFRKQNTLLLNNHFDEFQHKMLNNIQYVIPKVIRIWPNIQFEIEKYRGDDL